MPASLHRYQYVYDSPATLTDSYGNFVCGGGCIGGLVIAGFFVAGFLADPPGVGEEAKPSDEELKESLTTATKYGAAGTASVVAVGIAGPVVLVGGAGSSTVYVITHEDPTLHGAVYSFGAGSAGYAVGGGTPGTILYGASPVAQGAAQSGVTYVIGSGLNEEFNVNEAVYTTAGGGVVGWVSSGLPAYRGRPPEKTWSILNPWQSQSASLWRGSTHFWTNQAIDVGGDVLLSWPHGTLQDGKDPTCEPEQPVGYCNPLNQSCAPWASGTYSPGPGPLQKAWECNPLYQSCPPGSWNPD
jgi:hypothetical protein